jgi:hypothetical protein
LPPVYVVTTQEMVKEGCDDSEAAKLLGCGILGFYQYPPHERIIAEDNVERTRHSVNAILVHELTHWLQHHNWVGPDLTYCPREFLREYEAYLAGYRYEVIYEHVKAPEEFVVPAVDCPFSTSP